MKLKVLLDNNTYIDQYFLGEPGASYYIEDEGAKLLLDTGYSGVFLDNAGKMGVDLSDLDAVVLSHGHNDHTGGLPRFFESGNRKSVCVIAHPRALDPKWSGEEDCGSPMDRVAVAARCRLVQSQTPLTLSKNLMWLGEIPRTVSFEKPYAIGETENGGTVTPDYMADDSALVFTGADGIYVITGCSHSGICNILEYAKKVTGRNRICGLIGGLHLFDENSQRTKLTIQYLKEQNIPELWPCHCTSFAVRAALHACAPVKEVGVGLELNWE